MSWYLGCLKKYTVFRGRARRKEFWYFMMFNTIIFFFLGVIDTLTGSFNAKAGIGLLGAIYMLAVLIPAIAVSVRRLHDTDRSGWWLLITPIPIIGALVLFVFYVQDSFWGVNQYGSDPTRNPAPEIVPGESDKNTA